MNKTLWTGILLAGALVSGMETQAGVRVIVTPWGPRAIVVAPAPVPPLVAYPAVPPPEPASLVGYVDVNVKPGDADVIVDGKLRGKAQNFTRPRDFLALSVGTHDILISRDGFKSSHFSVTISPAKTIELDVTLTPLAPKAKVVAEPAPTYNLDLNKTGYVTLNVEPRDAVLYIDDNFYGAVSQFMSPNPSLVLRDGPHKIELSRPGYLPLAQTIVISDDKPVEINVLLKKAN